MTNEQLWQSTLGELELLISKANFTTWFKNTYIESYANDRVVVAVPNAFTKAWLEKKYHEFIVKAIKNIAGQEIKEIIYNVNTSRPAPVMVSDVMEIRTENIIHRPVNRGALNPYYIFENFIIGKNSELAHAASRAVSENPGGAYNPLFIYGGSGLGKTHLLQAIGHEILKKTPDKQVLYVTCEKFTNEFIEAISKGKMDKFKNSYRNIDVLLVDDIQFLAGKEGTQEEFFHTFNTLHQANKQIVLTSDRPPKAIPTLEQRLVSRFEWGMLADIMLPDLETRIAILEAKCKDKNYILTKDVINYLASNAQNNIRELEGSLNKIMAWKQLNNQGLDLESVKNILQYNNTPDRSQAITPKKIISVVCKYFDISNEDLVGASRKKQLVFPRQIAMYLMRSETKSSYPNIGQELGGRDHTTAMHAYLKIVAELKTNQTLQHDINSVIQQLSDN